MKCLSSTIDNGWFVLEIKLIKSLLILAFFFFWHFGRSNFLFMVTISVRKPSTTLTNNMSSNIRCLFCFGNVVLIKKICPHRRRCTVINKRHFTNITNRTHFISVYFFFQKRPKPNYSFYRLFYYSNSFYKNHLISKIK